MVLICRGALSTAATVLIFSAATAGQQLSRREPAIAVTQVTNFNAFAGFGTQRPDLTMNPNLPASQQTTAQFFNTAAFTVAPQFTIGNSSRNPVRGPNYRNADVAPDQARTIRRNQKS